MDYLTFVVLVVPAIIGFVAALTFGPNRGVITGAIVMLVAVFVLLLFQVTPPISGPGSETGRMGYASGLMQFEWIRWLPSFLVGAALGSIIFRVRRKSA
ncbi:MAG: hypothetical protein JSR61_02375 [Proteobacteria bacterium]|nr:hypothetical protein [Pseudomonadota bacterium]